MTSPAYHLHNIGQVKLGKAPAREGVHAPAFLNYATSQLPPAPSVAQWGVKVPTFPMYANDQLGDCTCAAVGHMEQCWTSQHNQLYTASTTEVTDMYWATGDGSGTDDTGRVETDVLNYWHNTGFGNSKRKIAGYVSVNPLNRTEIKQAAWLFGGLYIGIALPISAQNQTYWKLVADDGSGDTQPGSWGGHAVNVTAYCSQYLVVATWGMRMKMSWGFWNKYVDEAYGVLAPEWATGAIKAPDGFDFNQLQADLSEF